MQEFPLVVYQGVEMLQHKVYVASSWVDIAIFLS